MRPTTINILGITYTVEYCNNAVDVDSEKRQTLWGQIDFWTRSIRIRDQGRSDSDILYSLLHEVLHGIIAGLHIKQISEHDDEEEIIEHLAIALADVLVRNGWLKD